MRIKDSFNRSNRPGETTDDNERPAGPVRRVGRHRARVNFPSVTAAGMRRARCLPGNTVVFKPSSESPLIGYELYRAYVDAGVPDGVFTLIVGPGATVGAELQRIPESME